MNSNMFLKILIVILIFIILLIVWFFTLDDLHSWINFEPDNVQIAEGTVVKSYYDFSITTRSTRAGRRYRHKTKVIIVEYKVNGKTYTTKHRISYGDDSQVGDTREVSYNEKQPKYGYVRPTSSIYILYYTILIFGIIILCIFIIVIGVLLFYSRIVKKYNYL